MLFRVLQLIGLVAAVGVTAAPVSFEREIQPLLERRCNECHHPEDARGGLDLTRLSTMLRGGDELGASVVPAKPAVSPLIQVLIGEQEPAMPKKADSLPNAEIDLLRRWIAEGAKDDTPSFSAADVAFFEREIRPVLHGRCFKCHAGEEPESGLRLSSRAGFLLGGERGPAVMPGKPDASRLMAAIRHEGELKMPRGGGRLGATQVEAMAEWIRRGLPWPGTERVLTREKVFSISAADREHWAFRALPKQLPKDWGIDGVLADRHRAAGLVPTGRVDRYRLLRRVSYDLIGYPPTVEEIEAFVADKSEGALGQVVDRLLASELYGWRWGRHWLDYTRNGANGQSNRGPAMDAKRYERWVTKCFNEDRPWDWFARVHIAGDRMPAVDGSGYSFDHALAAAVPLNGPRTFQNASTETFVLMDKLDEGIEFMGRSLLGISLECARCHDHKFDPISQRDYYGLLGFFQSSWFGPVSLSATTPAAADTSVQRYRQLLSDKAVLNGRIRKAATVISVRGGELRRNWKKERQDYLRPWDKRLAVLEIAVLEGELKAAKETPAKQDLSNALAEKRAALADFRPRFFDVRTIKELRYSLGGHKTEVGFIARARTVGLEGIAKELAGWDKKWEIERAYWNEIHRFGGYPKKAPEVKQLADWDDEIICLQVELDALDGRQMLVRCEGGLRRSEDLASFKEAAEADKRQFYPDLVPAYVGDARLLRRGDVLEPGERIPRGYPEFFGGGTPEVKGSGRLVLAEWLSAAGSVQEALMARTVVNRAWQNLFGEGLCRTPKELGRLGQVPEMPEMIDGLAVRFIAGGWSVKRLVREIVLSEAYQRSAVVSADLLKRDPENRWLARQTVRRLELEPIMNTMTWLRHGLRHASPDARNAKLMGVQHFAPNFDGPTADDLISRRVASISATQALFMMNNGAGGTVVATGLATRHLGKSNPELTEILPALYRSVYQRPPTEAELVFAKQFVKRVRAEKGGQNPASEIREFIHLLLCSNELIYLE